MAATALRVAAAPTEDRNDVDASSSGHGLYIVQWRDTLSSIARSNNTPPDEILDLNPSISREKPIIHFKESIRLPLPKLPHSPSPSSPQISQTPKVVASQAVSVPPDSPLVSPQRYALAWMAVIMTAAAVATFIWFWATLRGFVLSGLGNVRWLTGLEKKGITTAEIRLVIPDVEMVDVAGPRQAGELVRGAEQVAGVPGRLQSIEDARVSYGPESAEVIQKGVFCVISTKQGDMDETATRRDLAKAEARWTAKFEMLQRGRGLRVR
ncbi:LysM domain containing protein [Klebsormidium nitens]|uniref:LysM domain containing protein n=1 Tax=Klebsormidium nitens TaxID=105231 RepID=A0A1Y1HIT7_KLENI|nr:LysM domain containing protein [Klebsormidium nitens]|eukprot:GAQ78415.1 LysM domain containing protein [Klebsormidium nitens]